MVRFSFRSWLSFAPTGLPVRKRQGAYPGIERLEDRVVLSAYSVTSTLDSVDVSPGDGVAADASGNATLRAAVMDSNATAGSDTITLGAGVFTMSLPGRSENAALTGDLDITGNLTIEGAGAGQTILDAAMLDRFFHVMAGKTLTLRNVTIRNGRESGGGAIQNDGTLLLENVILTGNSTTTRGGAIYNNTGTLTLQSVNLIGNSTGDVPTSSANGGAVGSFGGTVTIVGCQFASNTATGDGGAIDSRSTTLQITNSTFQGNFANVAGAVRLFNGTATLTNNTFNGDHANTSGGALASNLCALTINGGSFTGNYLSPAPTPATARMGGSLNLVGVNSSSPTVNINGVTFQQTGSGDGGGIYVSNVRVNLSNSTFDRVSGRQGGAISNAAGGILTMVNTTIVGGTATAGGAILNAAQLQMTNCTISGNTSTSPSAAVANTGSFTSMNNLIAGNVSGADVIGAFTSLGGNLIGNGSGSTGFTQPADQVGTATSPINPLLSPLANNGGTVPTMAIAAKSPARDAGVSGGPATDARGLPRTSDKVDIGAYEYQNHLPVAGPFNVTSKEDEDLSGQLIASDADGDTLTYELLVAPTVGTLFVQPNGNFHYVPKGNAFGLVGFRYRATDGRGFSNNVDAEILIAPVNDAPTVSDQDFAIEENSSNGTVIGTVQASDIDSSVLTGQIVSGNEDGAFYLDPTTGVITVADVTALNFELTPTWAFVVRITDDGSPEASSLATITIHLSDINDAPQLESPTYAIDEMSPIGTVVGLVPYTDEDAQQSLTFEIASSDIPGAFAIDATTGQITVADGTLLDFETDANLLVRIRVTDPGTPIQYSFAVVTVNLNDVNDAPIILDQTFSLPENSPNGNLIAQIDMSDVDSTLLVSEILSGNESGAFALDTQTGKLFVANSSLLNFETNPTFSLVVRVTDNGLPALSDQATITISLKDVNEAPSVDSPAFAIAENSVYGSSVGTVTATDQDAGQSLTYSIDSGNPNGAFAIDAATGQIVVANSTAVNFEANPIFNLVVKVADNGTPTLYATTTVTISLGDINEAPVVGSTTFAIDENSANGSSVGTVTATDQDSGQTLTYSIESGNPNGEFAIDAKTGQIVVANSAALNFEVNPVFNLVVKVADNGAPTLYSTTTVTITLRDVNEAPQISSQSFKIDEKSPNGLMLGALWASDPDVGQSLAYFIVSGNSNGAFAINPATGKISVANSAALDFGTTPQFNLQVRVTDDGLPGLASTTTATVSLNPVSSPPTTATVVLNVEVVDPTNTIRLGKKFDVAILGSATFDTSLVNVGKVRFGKLGTENSLLQNSKCPVAYHYRDVNRDGRMDLVIRVDADYTGLQVGDTLVRLTGQMLNGQAFTSSSSIVVKR